MTDKPKQTRRGGRRDGLFQKRGWWWLDYTDADGRRHRQKAAPSYEVAKAMYRDKMNAIAKGEMLGVREEGMLVRDFVDRHYWAAVQAKLAPSWASRSRDILDALSATFGGRRLSGLRQDEIEGWYAKRLETVSATTANKELARLKHLYARAVEWRFVKTSPAAKVKKAKEPDGRVRYLTADERQALLDGANGRLRLYIAAALQTGARRAELMRLRWSDVDEDADADVPEDEKRARPQHPDDGRLLRAAPGAPPPAQRLSARAARLRGPARTHPLVRPAGRARRAQGCLVPRSAARRRQHVDDGRRLPAGRDGSARAPRPAHDHPLPAPRARPSSGGDGGARRPNHDRLTEEVKDRAYPHRVRKNLRCLRTERPSGIQSFESV
jgi:integrase